MVKWVSLPVVAGMLGGLAAAGIAAEVDRCFFRADSTTSTILGLPDRNTVPVRAEIPAATSTPFRLEWIPGLDVTDSWATVAMAAATAAFQDFDYLLPVADPARILWADSFGTTAWTQTWQVAADKDWGWSNLVRVAAPGERFEAFLRASYPAHSCSPASSTDYGTPEGGGQFLATAGLPPANALHLRYYVRFHTNFTFVKGGKLPGLFGGTNSFSGGAIPDGTNGFSVRYMWRTNGEGEAYAYLATSDLYGTEIGRGRWTFQPGVWHCLEQRVVLNTPGTDDGRLAVWVDGHMVVDERALRFRTTDALRIRGIFFSTFFGGGDPSWATPHDTFADFAGFALSSGYIGP